MPFWNRNLDLIILTHPHLDHLNGLVEVLQRYEVKQILAPDLKSASPAYQEWLNLIQNKNIAYLPALAGQQIVLGGGAGINILDSASTPMSDRQSDIENSGIVARLSLNKISFLFTADISQEAEAKLINRRADLASTVLKIAHHGALTSTSPDFLAVVKPQIAAISAGQDNSFGHPTREVLARLKDTIIYRTDTSGTIEFTTDGQQLWVKTEK
jgi:competence protein ComEC